MGVVGMFLKNLCGVQLIVDVGEPGRIRTVCSGLVQFVQLNDMQVRY